MIGVYLSLAKASPEEYHEIEEKIDSAGVTRTGLLLHSAFSEGAAVGIFDVWERREDFDDFVERSCSAVPDFKDLVPDVQFVEMLWFSAP